MKELIAIVAMLLHTVVCAACVLGVLVAIYAAVTAIFFGQTYNGAHLFWAFTGCAAAYAVTTILRALSDAWAEDKPAKAVLPE
jgi:hypothetical protein